MSVGGADPEDTSVRDLVCSPTLLPGVAGQPEGGCPP